MSESNYYYAVLITKKGRPPFLSREHASAPALFWFHRDAVDHRKKCRGTKADIVKVFVRWATNGNTYNTPGDLFRSGEELKRKD